MNNFSYAPDTQHYAGRSNSGSGIIAVVNAYTRARTHTTTVVVRREMRALEPSDREHFASVIGRLGGGEGCLGKNRRLTMAS